MDELQNVRLKKYHLLHVSMLISNSVELYHKSLYKLLPDPDRRYVIALCEQNKNNFVSVATYQSLQSRHPGVCQDFGAPNPSKCQRVCPQRLWGNLWGGLSCLLGSWHPSFLRGCAAEVILGRQGRLPGVNIEISVGCGAAVSHHHPLGFRSGFLLPPRSLQLQACGLEWRAHLVSWACQYLKWKPCGG